MVLRILSAAIAAALLLCAASAAVLQQNAPPSDFPLPVWLEHKKVTQIPWTFTVGRPVLRGDFRQELLIIARVQSSELKQNGEDSDLVMYARVLENGHAIGPIHTVSERELRKLAEHAEDLTGAPPLRRNSMHSLVMPAIVRPGKYALEVALLDRGTGRYNTRYEDVIVSGPNDVVERSFASLSKFEFAEIPKPGSRDDLQAAAVGISFENVFPMILQVEGRGGRSSKLGVYDSAASAVSLPRFVIDKPGVLKLTIFSVLSPPDKMLNAENAHRLFQANLLNILSALTRYDVVNGSSDLIGLDLGDRSRMFDRVSLKDVQREALRAAITKDRTSVSLKDLADHPDNGKFLRDALAERLQEAASDTSGATHVIILAGARAVVPTKGMLEPIPAAADCHCKIFYVRFALSGFDKDDMPRLISAYKPRTFEPLTWAEFRDQFSTIYQQLLQ